MGFVILNGVLLSEEKFQEKQGDLPIDNGVFETLLVRDNTIPFASYHWKRLWSSAHEIAPTHTLPFTVAGLEKDIHSLVEKNKGLPCCRIRIKYFTESTPAAISDSLIGSYLIECFPISIKDTMWNEKGWQVGIASGCIKTADKVSHIKDSQRCACIAAATIAANRGWNDALLLNQFGRVVESSIANIWWVKDDVLHTPPLSEGCVAGVMRQYLLDSCLQRSIPVREQPLSLAELYTADEVFLSNAIRGIKWLSQIEQAHYTHIFSRTLYNTVF